MITKVKNLPYDENEWIYKQSPDCKCRFLLGKRGSKTLICCGVNPSFASPGNLDPTMKNVSTFAEMNGYDGFVMINLYPMRATNPRDLHTVMDPDIVKKNLQNIESILSTGNCDIWAAWGNLIKRRKYLKECLIGISDIADQYGSKWYMIGDKTKGGHPHHPLYLSKQSQKKEFDIHTYLKEL